MSTVTAEQIEATLRAVLQPESLEVVDDTLAHKGHAGTGGAESGTHFTVKVRARCFTGQTHVQRHRLVYDALRDLIPQGVHALAIKAEPV
ncbi:MAG TPA: BolA family protein [Aquabacterium sp.]|nr:BolA family protein [Aquabacterium sp.]